MNKTQLPTGSLDKFYSKTLKLATYFQLFKEELSKDPAVFSKMLYGGFGSVPQPNCIQT